MSSESRMRGRRDLRSRSKKPSRKVQGRDNAESYFEVKEVNPSEVTSSVLNAVDHLGNQRFVLPPFAEHFDRWLKDLQVILSEFETEIPQVVDENLHKEIAENMNNIRSALMKRTEAESIQSNESTKLHQQVAHCDIELSQLEHTYKNRIQDIRKQYENSDQKLRAEIDQLDRRRMQILRKNANIFRRIFRKSDTAIQGTSVALDSRRSKLRDSEQSLQNDLRRRRDEYTASRQKLLIEIEGLKQKIRELSESAGDDALEARRGACQRIYLAINGAQRNPTNAGSDSPPSDIEDHT